LFLPALFLRVEFRREREIRLDSGKNARI